MQVLDDGVADLADARGRLPLDHRPQAVDAVVLAASRGLGAAMPGLAMETLAPEERLAARGW